MTILKKLIEKNIKITLQLFLFLFIRRGFSTLNVVFVLIPNRFLLIKHIKQFLYPPRNIIDQALAHCSHSLLQPPRESGSYCISTQLYILSTSQRSQACKLLSYQLPNLTKLYIQHLIFFLSRICLDYILSIFALVARTPLFLKRSTTCIK